MCVGPFDEINFSAQMERRELANIFRPLETNDVLPSFSFRRREPPFHRLRDVYAGDHFRSSSVAFLRFLRCSRLAPLSPARASRGFPRSRRGWSTATAEERGGRRFKSRAFSAKRTPRLVKARGRGRSRFFSSAKIETLRWFADGKEGEIAERDPEKERFLIARRSENAFIRKSLPPKTNPSSARVYVVEKSAFLRA